MKKYFLFFTVFLYFVHQGSQAQHDKTQSIMRDKYAYETASEMYAVADTIAATQKIPLLIIPPDTIVAAKEISMLIEKINKEIKLGTLIEDDKIWSNLQQLEPYRMNEEVQASITEWVGAMNKYMPKSTQIPLSKVKEINKAYYAHDFDKVVDLSRQLLRKSSGYYDERNYAVRNNMALALMHQNKDLCAQIELEIIKNTGNKEQHKYIPALINLTVLYERLGKSGEAENLSDDLLQYTKKENITVPLVNFNAAWYMDFKNQQNKTNDGKIFEISRAFEQSDVEKYKTFIKHIHAVNKPSSDNSDKETGLAGQPGQKNTGALGTYIPYLLSCFIWWFVSWKLLGLMRNSRKFLIWFMALILYVGYNVFDILMWGKFNIIAPLFSLIFLILLIIRCATLRRRK